MTIINEADILAALKNGEDPEVLANYLIDTLNNAIKTYEKDREVQKQEAKKTEICAQISTLMNEFYAIADPEFLEEADITPEFVRDLLTSSAASCKRTMAAFDALCNPPKKDGEVDVDAAIANFLKKIGL